MSDPLTASDFWPLILKLSHDERVRLAKLALRAAAHDDSVAAVYAAAPRTLHREYAATFRERSGP